MESGLRPAGCRPPLTSLFRQILRTLGAQNRREDTNLAKAGFLILALHGTVGLFFYLPGFGICRKRNTKNGSGSGIRKARLGGNTGRLFFFRGKSIFTLRKGGKRRKATKRGKRRQCPSSCKSCVSAVMPRAMCIGESNRPGRKMKQRRPTHGFRQRRCPCRRGEGMRRAGILRSVYVRTHDARDNCEIRPEICPNMGAARNFFKFFKKFSFSVQRTGTKYRVYNIRTLLCTSKCSASRAFLRPHTQNSHPIPCKPVNIRKPAHGLKQIRSEMCKTAPDPD